MTEVTNDKEVPFPWNQVGPGWKFLIDKVMQVLEKERSEGAQIEIDQVKEKFGTLRFYVSGGSQKLSEIVDWAEEESCHMCENCGSREINVTTEGGWMKTLCKNCREKK